MYVCMSEQYVLPTDTKGRHLIPLDLELEMVM